MKKLLISLAAIALFLGCSKEASESTNTIEGERIKATAFADNTDATRSYIDQNGETIVSKWSAGDKISLFNGSTANSELTLTKGADTATGEFEGTAASGGTAITGNYAVYPYKSANEISAEGVFTVNYPAAQTYRADSYGEGANVMVAKSSDTNLNFKNANGFLELKLTGSEVIKSITIRGNNGEPLAGVANITLDENGIPVTTMSNGGSTTVTLDCGEGVQLSSSVPTSFIIALPPTEFTKGITVDVDNLTFGRMTQSTSNPLTISRNRIRPMSAFAFVATSQVNQIEYTANVRVTPYDVNVFGAPYNAEKSTYDPETKRGVLVFDGVVTKIGVGAFYNTSLTAITIPEGVTSIGDSAFDCCESLTAITIPEGVTSIGDSAFFYCTSLTSITIPEGVTSIGYYAFSGCESLTAITIPEGVTSIRKGAFGGCTSLTNITIPKGVTSIEQNTFHGCTYLTSITIPEGVTSIRDYAFLNCTSLTNITIPKGVTSIEQNTFNGCTSLSAITIPEGVTSIGENTFLNCISLTTITIPKGVTSIGAGAFHGCTSLTTITIPEGVTSIGDYAFFYCSSLTSITIPEGVTSIGEQAFFNCRALKIVNCLPVTPPSVGSSSFDNTHPDLVIYVPNMTAAAYKAASGWSNYASRIQVKP